MQPQVPPTATRTNGARAKDRGRTSNGERGEPMSNAGLVGQGFESMLLWVLTENARGRRFYERLGGVPLRAQSFTVDGQEVEETAYGWLELPGLLASLSDNEVAR